MPCDYRHPANPGVGSEHKYATGHESDKDLGREKDMRDAEEPLKAQEMMGEDEGPCCG